MGQSTTGAALRADASVTHSFTKPKGKKRETLSLKRSRIKQSVNKQDHFQSSLDFSRNKEARGKAVDLDASFDAIPVLTAAVAPVVTNNTAVAADVNVDSIPVLDKPFIAPDKTAQKINPFLIVTALLLVLATGMMLFGESSNDNMYAEPLIVTPGNFANYSNAQNQTNPQGSTETAGTDDSAAITSVSVDHSELLLVQNIVGLLNQEQFARETTIDAFLNVWNQLNSATKATLNNTPWFLRFVFSLQKQSRIYLQSPTSYDANYNIKINSLLNLAIAVGVMDQRGIQSRAENYSSQQSELVDKLKAEISQIEKNSKQHSPTSESIEKLNKKFRRRYALTKGNSTSAESVVSQVQTAKVNSAKDKTSIQENTIPQQSTRNAKTREKSVATDSEAGFSAVELDSLITRFVTAYEHGDLRMLVSLFSPTAKTNDKTNLSGIRQDYKQLFELSSFRILNLMNMRWSSSPNSMKGIGDYEIQIAIDEAGNAHTLHGKIQFVVGKVDNQLRITRLYHLER